MKNIFKIIFLSQEEYNERGRKLEEEATKACKMGDKYGKLYIEKLGIKDSACLRDWINTAKGNEENKLIQEMSDNGIDI